MERENLTLTSFNTGMTFFFFSTSNDEVLHSNGTVAQGISRPSFVNSKKSDVSPAYIVFNNLNQPILAQTYDGTNLWKLNNENINFDITTTTNNVLTGYSKTEKINTVLESSRITKTINSFDLNVSGLTSGASTQYVFTAITEFEDFHVDIKLERSIGVLDTLGIYNNLLNSTPVQEAETGVVFGRLEAVQVLKDINGNNIRIPLRNVPIGIFNSSEDFPDSTSVDINGDRISFNLKESANQNEYFNTETFTVDTDFFLRSGSQFTNIPEQYRYMTKTNNEGEFVLYDIPVGSQTLVFEIDLLKQGLTKDEVALNFFPYEPGEDSNIDRIPSFVFRQIPIDVVPAWGPSQSGYTETNISINIDLRKWATYFYPPAAVGGLPLSQAVAKNPSNTLKISYKDMTKPGFPESPVKFVQIFNDFDRDTDQQLLWNGEFAQFKKNGDFFESGLNIVKLPANLYDEDSYRTDKNGVPMVGEQHRGVWLCAYQLELSSPSIKRTTGSVRAWQTGGIYFLSHFDLNHSPLNTLNDEGFQGLGVFPYEKPWSLTYPNNYKIPKKPTKIRNNLIFQNPLHLYEPRYEDGDLVGAFPVFDPVGAPIAAGYGMMNSEGANFSNRIGQVVTKSEMYKYEKDVALTERYANGWAPRENGGSHAVFHGLSEVENGETYQRVEAGYGYFMRVEGLPRVARQPYGNGSELMHVPDTSKSDGLAIYNGNSENPGPGTTSPGTSGNIYNPDYWNNDIYLLDNQLPALAIDSRARIKKGMTELYRVVDSGPNLAEVKPFLIPTTVQLDNGASSERCYAYTLYNRGSVTVTIRPITTSGGFFFLSSTGTFFPSGSVVELPVNGYISYFFPFAFPNVNIAYSAFILPGNANFNPLTNKFEAGIYQVYVSYTGAVAGSNPKVVTLNAVAKTVPDTYYLKTVSFGGGSGVVNDGLNTVFSTDPNKGVAGLKIETFPGPYCISTCPS